MSVAEKTSGSKLSQQKRKATCAVGAGHAGGTAEGRTCRWRVQVTGHASGVAGDRASG